MKILFINGSPIKRFAALYGMEYGGMATEKSEALKLEKTI